MSTNINIRLAVPGDCEAVLSIYSPFITGTAVTFECVVPTAEAFLRRMTDIQNVFPWLLCEVDGAIAGYAYLARFKERQAYDWSVHSSVYLAPEYHSRGIGKALYFALIELARLLGYYNICTGVTLPNIRSERLHESFGFELVGVYRNVGYKCGKWHDVKQYSLKLGEYPATPDKPRVIGDIRGSVEFRDIINKALAIIT